MKTLTLVSILTVLPAAAGAQDLADPRWNGWLGCWELVIEGARQAAPAFIEPTRGAPDAPAASRPEVCVQPAPGGATFTTRVGPQVLVQETVVADGQDHALSDDECTGTRRAEWSHDGLSLYSSADLACAGDADRRRVSGLATLGLNGTWTDIQAVSVGDQETVRVRRYRQASIADRTRRGRARTLTLEDIQEASAKVSPAALEAALVETGSSFTLSGERLLALEQAGVAPSVIDLMVALSYPERFAVERTLREDRVPDRPLIDDPYHLGWAFGYPAWSDYYGFYSPLYGHYSPFFYSPFAYSYLRGYDPRYIGPGGFVTGGVAGGGVSIQPSGTGRVVDGQGYTRVRPREVVSASSDGTAGTASRGRSSSASGGGGGGSVSPQGFSGGGDASGSSGSGTASDSGGSGRTAQPR